MMCQSLMQTPVAFTLTRASPAFGPSCSRSRISSGLLTSVRTAARIGSLLPFPECCHITPLRLPAPTTNPALKSERAEAKMLSAGQLALFRRLDLLRPLPFDRCPARVVGEPHRISAELDTAIRMDACR